MTCQHNRAFNPARMAKRKTYAGFDYRTGKPRTESGRAWQEEIDLFRVEHNGDCVAAYVGASLILEIYEKE